MASSPAAAAPRVLDRLRGSATAAGADTALEPDPLVFAWRSAPRQHVLAAAIALGVGLPVLWIGLLVVRDLIAVLFGPARDAAPFLRLVVDLPARLGGSQHVLFPGWTVAQADFGLVALPMLVALGALGAACGAVVARCAFAAEGRAVARMREIATDTILATGTSGREDARGLASLVGAALRASEGWLAGAILLPALAIGTSLLALGMAAAVRPPLALVSIAGIGAVGILRRALLARRESGTRLWRSEGAALEGALTDLVRRLPAVRAHGTAAHERRRLSAEARVRRRTLGDSLAAVGRTRALAIGLAGLLMALMLGTLLFTSQTAPVEPGPFAAALAAFAIAARAVSALARSRVTYRKAAPLVAEASDAIEAIRRRHRPAARGSRRGVETGAIPAEGELALVAASAYDPVSGERLTAADLFCPMPSHVAIVGGRGSGARALAALIAGQLAPTAGHATFAGRELARLDGAARAERIGFASGDAVLVTGTLLENLLYGCREAPTGGDLEARLAEAMTVTGLDRLVYARGLSGVVDAEREASAVPALLEARGAVREALVAQGADHLVEPFDPHRYNRQADLGENILFGEPVGDHFAADDLARHPFLQAVLEAEGLTRPLTELGLSVARSTTEIFADLPDDHPLFDAFSLFPAAERGFFEDLVARQRDARTLRRGPAGARDRDRLIGLALGYNETRHRFGLVDAAFEAQIVSARRTFSRLLPQTLVGAIEFYDPARLTPAAKLQDNLLFGRIAQDEAGADARVSTILRGVLAERRLERLVYRIGLTGAVDPRATGNALVASSAVYGLAERATIELARCLIRRSDILVVAPQPEGGAPLDLDRLIAARSGRGLVLCVDEDAAAGLERFDTVVKVERGVAAATP